MEGLKDKDSSQTAAVSHEVNTMLQGYNIKISKYIMLQLIPNIVIK